MAESLKVQLRRAPLIFACGTALFSDGYANGVIGGVNTRGLLHLLIRIYGKKALSDKNIDSTLTSLSYAGITIGMLIFGFLSDKVGRKFGMMASSGIIVAFSALAAMSSGANGNVHGLLGMLCATRFFIGIGIGAEYPCGSVAASEQSEEDGIGKYAQHRWLTLATNSMIAAGRVLSSFIPFVMLWILGDNHLSAVWRVSLAFGVVPALGVFLWRFNMEESPRYKTDSMKYTKIPYILIYRRYGVRLAAISSVWFLYDFVAYPFAIYSSAILNDLTGGSDSLRVIFGWNVVLSMFSLPGSIGGAFLVDYIGAKNTLIIGLVSQVAVGFIMSDLRITSLPSRQIIYGIFLSFGDFGAGNCTFVLASKAFPTAVRGHFFGIAAAVGKVGAFAGTWGAPSLSIPRIDLVINCSAFPSMIQAFGGSDTTRGNTGPFWVAGGVTMLTAIVAFFFVAPVSRDGMIEEDMRLREYLTLHGYDVSDMGIGRKGDIGRFIGFGSLEATKTGTSQHLAQPELARRRSASLT
ncbi:MFS Git1p-related glycerophosphoinositol and glycerophosphocholine permease [Infundibulicybe gibba]|nr:MFS Git1p-related glycerophosphoinositol and glycerophosphocholine permease [Infundibulicybe gibba]